MNWFARAAIAVAVCASAPARADNFLGPVCGLRCLTPQSANPAEGTNNTFCANVWNDDGSGYQCLSVGSDARSFAATYLWTSLPVSVVHSYPHVKLGSALLPLQFKSIDHVAASADWWMGPTPGSAGASTGDELDLNALTEANTVANVAFDIWADIDPVKAANESFAGIEIMVWLGRFGPIQPLGFDNKESGARQSVGDHQFTLYIGKGPQGQGVYTWVPDTNYTKFSQDLSPLVQYLWRNNLISEDAYVGTVGFGSESFFAEDPITFNAANLALNISNGIPSSGATPILGQGKPWATILFGLVGCLAFSWIL